jgi:hypothetical protein
VVISIAQLAGFVETLGISPHTFRIASHDLYGDGLLLRYYDNVGWAVYCLERGAQYNLSIFQSEDEACRHFLQGIKVSFSPFENAYFKSGDVRNADGSLVDTDGIVREIDRFLNNS